MKALKFINIVSGIAACLCFAAFLTGASGKLGLLGADTGRPLFCLLVLGGLLGSFLCIALCTVTRNSIRQIASCQDRMPYQDGVSHSDYHHDGSSRHSL